MASATARFWSAFACAADCLSSCFCRRSSGVICLQPTDSTNAANNNVVKPIRPRINRLLTFPLVVALVASNFPGFLMPMEQRAPEEQNKRRPAQHHHQCREDAQHDRERQLDGG